MIRILNALIFIIIILLMGGPGMSQDSRELKIMLPEPAYESGVSLEECLASRRSVREYRDRALTLQEVSQLLWAAQGITSDWGARTAPSAGGLFPVTILIASGNVDGLDRGSWKYNAEDHSLTLVVEGDILPQICTAALNQESVSDAAMVIAITAKPEITEVKYGDRSMRYIDNEAGAICQNIYLQCETLDLGTVCIGAFYDDDIAAVFGTENEVRLIMPVGPI